MVIKTIGEKDCFISEDFIFLCLRDKRVLCNLRFTLNNNVDFVESPQAKGI